MRTAIINVDNSVTAGQTFQQSEVEIVLSKISNCIIKSVCLKTNYYSFGNNTPVVKSCSGGLEIVKQLYMADSESFISGSPINTIAIDETQINLSIDIPSGLVIFFTAAVALEAVATSDLEYSHSLVINYEEKHLL